ncbi:arginine--tRNA ligase [Silvibacterium sp.]|uniref:arginine--tRNA ligase n=1 Tax=Silvibacterium sp. TaxID=1964179 RepID=UPI0039E48F85
MYLKQQKALSDRLLAVLFELYEVKLDAIVIEQPPEIAFGEFATPLAFELARKLRKAPKKIAEEIVAALGEVPGFAGFEVAGAGYINARLDRGALAKDLAAAGEVTLGQSEIHSLVEHTSINPNKAAHVGHLRNAILGDTFVRLLRAAGQKVDVQNYIDNTGVQVADIVVGLTQLEKKSLSEVEALMTQLAADGTRIDYYCWDLYARVSQWYDAEETEKAARKKIRLDTLHLIEHGGNETAEIADRISTAVLRRHLETMLRLDIEYDLLPRESEILHLHFWDLAFEQLKERGVLYFETEGKNKGCWVMRRPGSKTDTEAVTEGPDEDAKVIVRSNGTVTYVGKDIAYHLWKFGLLGRDFAYNRFFTYPDHECWISAETGEADHPHFGGATAIYNVIDSRQADPQANVIEALRGMGYTEQAARYTHFSYEMVALTPRCAMDLGYTVSEEDQARPYIEVSGRKGFGVKADDLIDKLIAATLAEVVERHPELDDAERQSTARAVAVGALRYFMLKYTRNTVIAFDFKDALSFEGETGPYLQYAVVRTRSIFRKAETTPEAALAAVAGIDPTPYLAGEEGASIWQVWLRASKTSLLLEQCIATAEPAYLAKHAFQLAQEFSGFYKKNHILTEADPARKALLLATAAVAQRELIRALDWLGIDAPEVM